MRLADIEQDRDATQRVRIAGPLHFTVRALQVSGYADRLDAIARERRGLLAGLDDAKRDEAFEVWKREAAAGTILIGWDGCEDEWSVEAARAMLANPKMAWVWPIIRTQSVEMDPFPGLNGDDEKN